MVVVHCSFVDMFIRSGIIPIDPNPAISAHTVQCPKLWFYFVRSQGARLLNLCTGEFLHAPSVYVPIITGSKNVHTPGAHLRKSCTRP